MGWMFLIQMGLFVFTVLSMLVYGASRAKDRLDTKRFVRDRQAVRSLSAGERDALLPFLLMMPATKNPVTLESEEVYPLTGEVIRHGIHAQGNTVMHVTLGGVDVMLPYDADQFLKVHNSAEVVMAKRVAIVVRLNSAFDVVSARDRHFRTTVEQQAWSAGEPLSREGGQAHDAFALQMRGQRDMTTAERQAQGIDYGVMLAMLSLLGALLLMGPGSSMAPRFSPLWIVVGILLAVWSIRRFLVRRVGGEVEKVNRLTGSLATASFVNAKNVSQEATFVSGKIRVHVPPHWRQLVRYGVMENMEVGVESGNLLRYGAKLSVDEEEKRFPTAYFARFVLLFLVGVVGCVVTVSQASLREEALHLKAILNGPPTPRLSDVRQGSLVDMPVEGYCLLSYESAAQDCTSLRVFEPDMARASVSDADFERVYAEPWTRVFSQLHPLQQGLFFDGKKDMRALRTQIMLGAIVGMQYQDTDYYMPSEKFTSISLAEVVHAVDASCTPSDQIEPPCSDLRHEIVVALKDELGIDPTWGALRDLDKANQLGDVVVSSSVAASWKHLAQRAANQTLWSEVLRQREQARVFDRGGVLVKGAHSFPLLPQPEPDPASTTVEDREAGQFPRVAEDLHKWVQGQGIKRIRLQGLVVKMEKHGADPIVVIDRFYTANNWWESLAHWLATVIAALATSVGMWLIVRRTLDRRRRSREHVRLFS